MTRISRTAVSIFSFTAIVAAGYTLADEPARYDYAGLAVAKAELVPTSPLKVASTDFAALEPFDNSSGCEVIQSQFDYAGLPQAQCSTSVPQEEPEWSYLY